MKGLQWNQPTLVLAGGWSDGSRLSVHLVNTAAVKQYEG